MFSLSCRFRTSIQETVAAPFATAQIAPTILKVLGLDPNELEAVRAENTAVLPDFN